MEELKKNRAEIHCKVGELHAKNFNVDGVTKYLENFAASYEKISTGQKRVLISTLIRQVIVKSKYECQVIFTLPVPTSTQPLEKSEKGNSDEKNCLFSCFKRQKPILFNVPVTAFVQNGVADGI